MHKVTPFMASMKEVYIFFDIHLPKPEVFCRVSEDNQSFITFAVSNSFSPRKKYIAIKYRHLRSFLQKKIIWICYIDTQEQTAEFFTKPLDKAL